MEGPIVHTSLGTLQGTDRGDFLEFRGVPYAEPPGRFEAPVPKKPWQGTRDATRFGDACIANSGNGHKARDPKDSYKESEDCLYANVWAPKGPRHGLPVVVWIHGGGFMRRSGSFPAYWGDKLVTREVPVIYVSFNYRLGIFGFVSFKDGGANFGFQDQQLALRFVQEHIEAFGGDPGRVTLVGQSAGAMSIVCHLASPGSKGLFQRAFLSSPAGVHYRSLEENEQFVRTAAHSVGCFAASSAKLIECLRSKPASALKLMDIVPEYVLHLLNPCPNCTNILPWIPVVDGVTLPRSPLETILRGEHNKVTTVISSVRNETLAFVPTLIYDAANFELQYDVAMDVLFKSRAPAVKRYFASGPEDWRERTGAASTDALFTCYARYLVRALARHAPTFQSFFFLAPRESVMHADRLCVSGPPHGATCHAGDIAYFIPQSARMSQEAGVSYNGGSIEEDAAERYSAALLGFAAGSSGPFEAYSEGSDASTAWELQGPGRVVGYRRDHCDFFESIGLTVEPWGAGGAATQAATMLV